MIYMTHPLHGAMHVYSEGEAVQNESRGWTRSEWPPKLTVEQVGTNDPTETAPVRKKPGPKPKAG